MNPIVQTSNTQNKSVMKSVYYLLTIWILKIYSVIILVILEVSPKQAEVYFWDLAQRSPCGDVVPMRGRANAGTFSAHANPILLKML
jgi:hypothetical protein